MYISKRVKTPPDYGETKDELKSLLNEINQMDGKIVAVLQHSDREFTIIYEY